RGGRVMDRLVIVAPDEGLSDEWTQNWWRRMWLPVAGPSTVCATELIHELAVARQESVDVAALGSSLGLGASKVRQVIQRGNWVGLLRSLPAFGAVTLAPSPPDLPDHRMAKSVNAWTALRSVS